MKKFVVRFKDSCNAELRQFFVIVDEGQIQHGIDLCWQKHERVYNALDYCSDEETEFERFNHEIKIVEQGVISHTDKREKDDLCAWEHVTGF